MITQTQQQLTDLNRAYFEGQLSYSDYRQKRGLMLESLFEDITVTEDFAPKTVPMQKPAPQPTPAEESSNKLIYITIAVLVVCVGIAVALLLPGTPPQPTKSQQTTTSTKVSNKLEILIEESLRNNTWTPIQLSEIESRWKNMSSTERDNARQSHWYPKLTDTLDSLALEQKALVNLGNADAAAFEQQINRLVNTLNND